MFVAIMIIILGACAAIVWSMYFNTISMQKTYGAVNWYYWAYYWAMASIERWLLMSKIKYPTYEWSWWFKWDKIYWAVSNWFAEDFWKLTQWNNSLVREVDSSTTTITWVIDTKTLRLISFNKYEDSDKWVFKWGILTWSHWIVDGLTFSWYIKPRTPNTEVQLQWKTWRWESTDFNRYFSLKNTWYIVRWLNTTDTYWQWNPEDPEDYNRDEYDREWEKDFQLTWDFYFTKDSCNPWPALSWELNNEYNNYWC